MENQLQKNYINNGWDWRKKDISILAELSDGFTNITEFVQEYLLDPQLNVTNKNGGEKIEGVRLSTIHSAKGLEANAVYIVDASPQNYPSQQSIKAGVDEIEEERRCLYVAMTRAKDYLYMYSNANSASIDIQESQMYFLQNIPTNLVKITSPFSRDVEDNVNTDMHMKPIKPIDIMGTFDFN